MTESCACGRPLLARDGDLEATCAECQQKPDWCNCSPVQLGACVIRLADVEPERIDWLWPGYLPRRKVVVLDGDPDQGKSAVTVDWAAKISTGSPMPDGTEPVKGAVLILSAEDGLADTIRPRLDAAGGDPAQVITIIAMPAISGDGNGTRHETTRPVVLPDDLDAIEQVITAHGIVLVIIDVLMAYLSGEVNSHRDQDVRRALHPLAAMAERTGCCVLVIRHLNKSGGQHAIYRGGGSIGIVGAARAGFMIGTDPEDARKRVLAAVKCNLAERPPSLAFRLVADELHGCVQVEWLGTSARRAADLLGEDDDEARDDKTAAEEAAEWVAGFLADQADREAASAEVKKAARAAGIPERTLQRGRVKAKVRISTSGFPPRSVWTLPGHAEQPPRAESPPYVPTVPSPSDGTVGTNRGSGAAGEHGELPLDPPEGDTKATKVAGPGGLASSSSSVTFGAHAEPPPGGDGTTGTAEGPGPDICPVCDRPMDPKLVKAGISVHPRCDSDEMPF